MAEQLTIEILQGDSFDWEITVLEEATGLPMDLTGCTVRGMGRKQYTSPESSWEFICTINVDQVLDKGKLTVELTNIVTAALVSGPYKYDIELVLPNGKVKKLYRGTASVVAEVTKP